MNLVDLSLISDGMEVIEIRLAFIGRAGVGKTTLSRSLIKSYGFVRLSFAKPVKAFAQSIIFWRPLNKAKDRAFLQLLGNGVRDAVVKNVWIRWFEFDLRELEEKGVDNIVVDDCRYLNEAQFLRDNGFVIVRLLGRGYDLKGKVGEHVSETQLDEWTADYQIDSSGTMENSWRQLIDVMVRIEGYKK